MWYNACLINIFVVEKIFFSCTHHHSSMMNCKKVLNDIVLRFLSSRELQWNNLIGIVRLCCGWPFGEMSNDVKFSLRPIMIGTGDEGGLENKCVVHPYPSLSGPWANLNTAGVVRGGDISTDVTAGYCSHYIYIYLSVFVGILFKSSSFCVYSCSSLHVFQLPSSDSIFLIFISSFLS